MLAWSEQIANLILCAAPMSAFEGKSCDIAASKDPLPRLARSRIDESDQFCSHTAEAGKL
jgi:hypothetical protein